MTSQAPTSAAPAPTATATTAASTPGSTPAPGMGDMLMSFLPIILIFGIFYFLLIRPQQKRLKEHQDVLAALQKGDKVLTGGGILGTITKVGPGDELTVEIADNVRVRVLRSTLSGKEPTGGADSKAVSAPATIKAA